MGAQERYRRHSPPPEHVLSLRQSLSGVATALFTTFDGLAVTVWLFSHDGADWITLEAVGSGAAEADAKAMDARVANWTYKIPAGRAKVLRTRLADLVEPPKG